jgi:hypothetical protein
MKTRIDTETNTLPRVQISEKALSQRINPKLRGLNDLQRVMSEVAAGRVKAKDVTKIKDILVKAWGTLKVVGAGDIDGDYLNRHLSFVVWYPPLLSLFVFNRSYGTNVIHSQRWTVNVDTSEASLVDDLKYRDIPFLNRPFRGGPTAIEIANAILETEPNRNLTWMEDGRVEVMVAVVVDKKVYQSSFDTRRRGFWDALEERLRPSGWTRASSQTPIFSKK